MCVTYAKPNKLYGANILHSRAIREGSDRTNSSSESCGGRPCGTRITSRREWHLCEREARMTKLLDRIASCRPRASREVRRVFEPRPRAP